MSIKPLKDIDTYRLKHKDTEILSFGYDTDTKQIENIYICSETIEKLPPALQRLCFNNQNGGLTPINNGALYKVSDNNKKIIYDWFIDRAVPVERYDEIKTKGNTYTNFEWMLLNHSISFNDCYWTAIQDENISWDRVKPKEYDMGKYVAITRTFDINKFMLSKAGSTLGGQLDKYWISKEDGLYLHKNANMSNEILSIREAFASMIYEKQGIPHTHYTLTKDDEGFVTGCDCKCFTNEQTELIPMWDVLESYNITEKEDTINIILAIAERNGLDKQQISDYLDSQTIVDYLITNRDRHLTNFGFLRDSDTLKYIGLAPIFDSGSCAGYEGKEEKHTNGIYLDLKVNSYYDYEMECLNRIHNFNVIDLSKLPSIEEYKELLDKGFNISERRKDELCSIYLQKIEYIRDRQLHKTIYPVEYSYLTTRSMLESDIERINNKNFRLKDNLIGLTDLRFFNKYGVIYYNLGTDTITTDKNMYDMLPDKFKKVFEKYAPIQVKEKEISVKEDIDDKEENKDDGIEY